MLSISIQPIALHPGAPKPTPDRLSSQMPRSSSIALQNFVLLKALLAVSPPHFGVVKHCVLFHLFSLQAADLDGEIDLSTCYDVTEYPVQRNYGFQIHVSKTREGGRVWLWDSQWAHLCCVTAWGCSSVAKETSSQTHKRGHPAPSERARDLWPNSHEHGDGGAGCDLHTARQQCPSTGCLGLGAGWYWGVWDDPDGCHQVL